jgi:DNA (cytosine-5)-methyltransferase 1
MKRLGDITKINGAEIEIVDVITGGSPCQDLSIAGKRAGLAGARSGLFMEQVRIVKEMREHDRKSGRTGDMVRPRFMVWENVPGAFSSNKGRDFAAVLEEIIRIAEPEAPDIEVPEKGWNTWGGYHDCMGGRWSVAWRVHDAQHWGVPQRRRRISVVADFGGDTAGEILFERKSVSRHPAESGTARERLAEASERGFNPAVEDCMTPWDAQSQRVYDGDGVYPTLSSRENSGLNRESVLCAGFKAGQGAQAGGIGYGEEVSPTLAAAPSGTNQTPAVVALDMTHACDVIRECGEQVPALQARMGTGGNQVPLTFAFGRSDALVESDVASTQSARQGKSATDLVCAVDCRNFREGGETNGTLQAKSNGGISYNLQNTVRTGMIVRRLTPMECERLQGYPDGWTDIDEWMDSKGKLRKPSDSPRYKALGNSIALPFWDFLAKRISAQYLRPVTMGSLFDGIGGFPLVFERHNGKGTARWASEIEEFPIAVTKLRFGEE